MIGILPCTCSSACQADSTCARLPRFQARLDAIPGAQQPRVQKQTEACATHLGAMVVAMTTWAREHALNNVDLTILAIEPPSWRGGVWREPRDSTTTSGLVFSIIHIGEAETALMDLGPSIWTSADLKVR
jgi:hypothetical protein